MLLLGHRSILQTNKVENFLCTNLSKNQKSNTQFSQVEFCFSWIIVCRVSGIKSRARKNISDHYLFTLKFINILPY